MRKAMVFTGQGIFTGALTTAGAFLAMGFTNFKGIQEMGIICGGGMLVCFVPDDDACCRCCCCADGKMSSTMKVVPKPSIARTSKISGCAVPSSVVAAITVVVRAGVLRNSTRSISITTC